jgi:hypothetical protein
VVYPGIDAGKVAALARDEPFIARGFLLSTFFGAALLALSWGALRRKIPPMVWILAVGCLLFADLARVDDPFVQTMDEAMGISFQQWASPDPNVQYLLERQAEEEPFRILAMGGTSGFGQDVKPGMFGLELANGHHPNDLARYRELIGMVGSGAPENLLDVDTKLNLPLLSILNVRYVIWPVQRLGTLPVGEPVMASSMDGRTPYEATYEIPTLPRARLVGEAVVLPEQETVAYLLSSLFRPDREVVLNEEAPIALSGGTVEGQIQWLERGLNRMRLSVQADRDALLVLSDNWFPAWKARVNGEGAPVLRANHTLRAVPVPAGASEVEVYFDVGTLRGAFLVSLASLVALGLLGGGSYWRRRRSGSEGERGREDRSDGPAPDGG